MDNEFYLYLKIIFFFLFIKILFYFFLSFFLNKNYFSSITFIFLLYILSSVLFIPYFVKDFILVSLIMITLINFFYIFAVAIYTPKSSVRFNILRILYENKKKISYLKLIKIYNDHKIVSKRLTRLIESKTLIKNKKYYKINSLKGFLIVYLFLFLKKILFKND